MSDFTEDHKRLADARKQAKQDNPGFQAEGNINQDFGKTVKLGDVCPRCHFVALNAKQLEAGCLNCGYPECTE